MMKAFATAILCGLAALTQSAALVRAQTTATLDIVVTGLRTDQGQVMLSLHQKAEGFPGNNAYRQQLVSIQGGVARFSYSDLPIGSYAVAIIHDENGNRKMDTNWLGLPKEGWGASRDPRPSMRGPRFEEAVFELKAPRQEVRLSVKY